MSNFHPRAGHLYQAGSWVETEFHSYRSTEEIKEGIICRGAVRAKRTNNQKPLSSLSLKGKEEEILLPAPSESPVSFLTLSGILGLELYRPWEPGAAREQLVDKWLGPVCESRRAEESWKAAREQQKHGKERAHPPRSVHASTLLLAQLGELCCTV